MKGWIILALLSLGLALSSESRSEDKPQAQVCVQYFHRTVRCPSCLDMESFAAAAVSRFAADQEAGRLAWQTINIDEPANRHFQQDYALEFNSLVLSRRTGGREVAWTNLPDVWALVGDKTNFVAYVEMEILKQLQQLPEN